MKGQIFESLSFLVLAVAITGIILFLRVFLVGQSGRTLITISDRHEQEGFKAGVSSLLKTTEPRSGKTLEELLGIAAYIGNSTINFGPGVGEVNVINEVTWKFDAIYGEGKWYLKVPLPDITPDIQVVVVSDVSGSMCDDIQDIRNGLPDVLETLGEQGRNAFVTLYLLPGNSYCVIDGQITALSCADFPETDKFHCRSLENLGCSFTSAGGIQTEEDWGTGLECAIEKGPYEGWKDFSVKIGIPLSDELCGGSECAEKEGGDCHVCPSQRKLFEKGLNKALEKQIKIFPLRADPCGTICYPVSGCRDLSGTFYCSCGNGLLVDWMTEIADKTGGKMFDLKQGKKAAEVIRDVISSQNPNRIPNIEAGTKPPQNKKLRAATENLPVNLIGAYTKIYLYQWS